MISQIVQKQTLVQYSPCTRGVEILNHPAPSILFCQSQECSKNTFMHVWRGSLKKYYNLFRKTSDVTSLWFHCLFGFSRKNENCNPRIIIRSCICQTNRSLRLCDPTPVSTSLSNTSGNDYSLQGPSSVRSLSWIGQTDQKRGMVYSLSVYLLCLAELSVFLWKAAGWIQGQSSFLRGSVLFRPHIQAISETVSHAFRPHCLWL